MQTIITSIIAIVFIGLYIYEKYFKKRKKSKLRGLEDVEEGEWILVQLPIFNGGMGRMKCITNNKEGRSMLLELTLANYKEINVPETQVVFMPYDSPYFINFATLNQIKHPAPQLNDNDITILEKQEQEFIKNDEFEKAQAVRNQINQILNKK